MEEIIKTLLLEGIDEATIHRVLDVIEEEYEVVDESNPEIIGNSTKKRHQNYIEAVNNLKKNFSYDNFMKFANASNKLENNVSLANKHYQRKGDSSKSPFKMKPLQDRNKIAKAFDNHSAYLSMQAGFNNIGLNSKANREANKWENATNRYMEKTNTFPRDTRDLKRRLTGK